MANKLFIKQSAIEDNSVEDVKLVEDYLKESDAVATYVKKADASMSELTVGATKTIGVISEANGVVTATAVNINIPQTQVQGLGDRFNDTESRLTSLEEATAGLSPSDPAVTTSQLNEVKGGSDKSIQDLDDEIIDLKDGSTKTIKDLEDAIEAEETAREEAIEDAIEALAFADTAVTGKYVSAVSETDGVIAVTRADIPVTDVQIDSTSIVASGIATIPTATNSAFGVVKVDNAMNSSSTNPVQNNVINTLTGALADITATAAKSDGTPTGDDPESLAEAINNVGINAATLEIVPLVESTITKYTIKRNGVALSPTIDVPTNLISLTAKVIDYSNPADQHYYTEHSLDTTKKYLMLQFGSDDNVVFIKTDDLSLTVESDVISGSNNPTQGGALYTLIGAANSDIISKIASTISARTSIVSALNEVEANKVEKIGLADEATEYSAVNMKITIPAAEAAKFGVVKLDETVTTTGENPVTAEGIVTYVTEQIEALDAEDTAVANKYVSAVSEEDGVITVTRADIPVTDIQIDSTSIVTSGVATIPEATASVAGVIVDAPSDTKTYVRKDGDWVESEILVQDVQINSVSIVDDGVADIPYASTTDYGVAKLDTTAIVHGTTKTEDTVMTSKTVLDSLAWTKVSGLTAAAIVEGSNSNVTGNYGIAEGSGCTAGVKAHAEGNLTSATGDSSHAEGNGTAASAASTHAEGLNTTASGYASHSEGNESTASGAGSHAECYNTTASGDYAHSEGYGTNAEGNKSHAEGETTTASGQCSHSEGVSTQSQGTGSHAEGAHSVAGAAYSHAEGGYTTISSDGAYAHTEGYYTKATAQSAHAEGHAVQNTVVGIIQATEVGAHAEGYADATTTARGTITASGKGAHAEGYSNEGGTILASNNGAHAEGVNTKATAHAAHAEGENTTASGQYSHAEGVNSKAIAGGSHVEGGNGTANSGYSHVEGLGCTASGYASHVEGEYTTTGGTAAHAEGESTAASGHRSHAEGYWTSATGEGAHVEGYCTHTSDTVKGVIKSTHFGAHAEGFAQANSTLFGTIWASFYGAHAEGAAYVPDTATHTAQIIASGIGAHAEGYAQGDSESDGAIMAIGHGSHAEGMNTEAEGLAAHAEGYQTVAEEDYSHAEGKQTKALATAAHSEGISTQAQGSGSHAEGNNCIATGAYGHAEGNETKAACGAHSEGVYTQATGTYSHAGGNSSIASQNGSFVHGFGLGVTNEYEFAIGKKNASHSLSTDKAHKTAFSLGVGESSTSQNGVEITENGDVYIIGLGNYTGNNIKGDDPTGTIQTLQEVINGISGYYFTVTQDELRTLRSEGKLIPGANYRIIDYTGPVSNNWGHQFDIIVIADSETVLNENARAMKHAGDPYFVDCDLAAWELKFDLGTTIPASIVEDMDMETYYRDPSLDSSSHFGWKGEYKNLWSASATPGTLDTLYEDAEGSSEWIGTVVSYTPADTSGNGIFYMKDEHGNEAPFDFKNKKVTARFERIPFDTSIPFAGYFKAVESGGTALDCYTFSIINNQTDTPVLEGDGTIKKYSGLMDEYDVFTYNAVDGNAVIYSNLIAWIYDPIGDWIGDEDPMLCYHNNLSGNITASGSNNRGFNNFGTKTFISIGNNQIAQANSAGVIKIFNPADLVV